MHISWICSTIYIHQIPFHSRERLNKGNVYSLLRHINSNFFFSLQTLREKEKGDWKKLTLIEKKQLYRASFAQTLVEIEAPTGEWKSAVGIASFVVAAALWIVLWLKVYGEFTNVIEVKVTIVAASVTDTVLFQGGNVGTSKC